MRFRVDIKIFLFLIIMYFTRQIETYVMIMFFAFLHELGHFFMGLILKMKPESISVMPLGFSVCFKINPKEFNQKIGKANMLEIKKIIIALAGPLVNLILMIVALNIQMDIFTKMMVVLSNFVLLVFNMIPIYPLDGARILKGIIHIFAGKAKSFEYIDKISFMFLIILTVLASFGLVYFENIIIFFVIVYLWIMYIAEHNKYIKLKQMYEIIEENKNASI